MLPKASVLWVNYNSMPIIDLVLSSLSSVNDVDYLNLELIVVDNGSTDGSFNVIRDFLEKMKIKIKVYRLNYNLGFAGGNNVAYRLIDDDSEYVVFLNNDAIMYPHSLREIIECMESMPTVGGAQGVIYDMNGHEVATAGNFLDEFLLPYALKRACKKIIPITYPSGCYMVVKRLALKNLGLVDHVFIGESFAYFDDNYLGMKLWNHGYKVVSFPIDAGLHKGSASFERYNLLRLYYSARAWITRILLSNTEWKAFALLYYFKRLIRRSGMERRILFKAYLDGIKLAKNVNESFNIYMMPIIRFSKKCFFKIPFYMSLQRYFGYWRAKKFDDLQILRGERK